MLKKINPKIENFQCYYTLSYTTKSEDFHGRLNLR